MPIIVSNVYLRKTFHNDISPHFKMLLFSERLDFCDVFFFNNADSFSQPSLIIFTKGADIFGHDCITVIKHIYYIFHIDFFLQFFQCGLF